MAIAFNWPCGAGGDFLISVPYMVEQNTDQIQFTSRNQWTPPEECMIRTFKLKGSNQEVLKLGSDDQIVAYHTLKTKPIQTSGLIINLYAEDIVDVAWIHSVFNIKVEPMPTQDEHCIIPGAVNLEYRRLVIQQEPKEILLYMKTFGITELHFDKVVDLFKLYHINNCFIYEKQNKVLKLDKVDHTLNFHKNKYNHKDMLVEIEQAIQINF